MNVIEDLNRSLDFLQEYITVDHAVSYLAKIKGLSNKKMATWLLQNIYSLNIMVVKIDRITCSLDLLENVRDPDELLKNYLRRIVETGQFAKSDFANEDVLGWNRKNANEMFQVLGFNKCEIPIENFSEVDSQDEYLDERERTSLLKIVAGMAAGGYGHDFDAKRNPTVSLIMQDIEKLGLYASDENVRKYLKQAAILVQRLTK
jgi:SAM-dependent methyltransferase